MRPVNHVKELLGRVVVGTDHKHIGEHDNYCVVADVQDCAPSWFSSLV